ncbi:hypothetical protein DIZ81_02000 [Legionella taurinensis]|uniref:Uncharacterized protein n=1 Tax=Legionella taurinensis TaxID=70611 RepID=A0A3A5L2U5_9GAMM|nr:hypothetical protein [Legionella taurinensis]MDX1836358.1 hypothetical protein [Legionella taurinensis]PUT41893.1 hypothetical protein DB744_02005 [Legionella taurinensis]PUT44682.1 hypothetical protein DB746_02005 [Legionella taurinensis]PUT48002.1 hypothetical protein DB743_00165 [Legionella taurinensis]PUT48815.1 hypothetical protein DB745_02005 [Legionella taurinensis]
MKPSLSEYYQYVLAGHARLDLSQVPPARQAQRRHFIIACIKEKFQAITEDSDLSLHFRRMLRQTGSELEGVLYGNQEDPLGPAMPGYEIPDDETIFAFFKPLNARYLFFERDDDEAAQQFSLFFKIGKMVNLYLEKSGAGDEAIGLQAYKMLVWHGYTPGRNPFARIESHVNTHGASLDKPLSDSLKPDLPINDPPIKKVEQWRKLIALHGQIAILLLQQAQAIEQGLKKNRLTLIAAIQQAAALRYERAREYPELASLCYQYNRPQSLFDQCLALRPLIKTRDRLPGLVIEGRDFGYRGYSLVKLPANDPNAYLLGEINHCCQSMGAASESIVRDGLRFENNGFLVLLKEKKPGAGPPCDLQGAIRYSDYEIVAHGYLWNSSSGLVLDSFESLRSTDEPAGIYLLQQYGRAVLLAYPQYRLFSLGAGGKTPAALVHEANLPLLFLTDPMLQGKQHLDSFLQFVVAERDLDQRRDALRRRLSDNKLGWDPDDLARLIAVDSLHTDSQFDSIETTLFDENICQLIRLFEAENPEKFSLLFLRETDVFLGLIYTLKQCNLTTDHTLCCQALAFTKITAIHTLKLLQQLPALDNTILKRLFSSETEFKKLSAICHALAGWNALNQSTFDLLLNAQTVAVRLKLQDKIQRLAKKNQVVPDDFLALVTLSPKQQQETLEHLCLLSEMGLFTPPIRRCLLTHPAHGNALLLFLPRLNHLHDQLTEDDYAFIQQHINKLPALQAAADFLADKNQLTRFAWRALIPVIIKRKSTTDQLNQWLEHYWKKETSAVTTASGKHGMFISKTPAFNEQEIDATIGRSSPPPA